MTFIWEEVTKKEEAETSQNKPYEAESLMAILIEDKPPKDEASECVSQDSKVFGKARVKLIPLAYPNRCDSPCDRIFVTTEALMEHKAKCPERESLTKCRRRLTLPAKLRDGSEPESSSVGLADRLTMKRLLDQSPKIKRPRGRPPKNYVRPDTPKTLVRIRPETMGTGGEHTPVASPLPAKYHCNICNKYLLNRSLFQTHLLHHFKKQLDAQLAGAKKPEYRCPKCTKAMGPVYSALLRHYAIPCKAILQFCSEEDFRGIRPTIKPNEMTPTQVTLSKDSLTEMALNNNNEESEYKIDPEQLFKHSGTTTVKLVATDWFLLRNGSYERVIPFEEY